MSLTPEQATTLEEFVEVTQSQSDVPRAIALLSSADWNLEHALALHFDDSPVSSTQPLPASANPRNSNQRAPISLMEELNQDLVTEQVPRTAANPSTQDVPPESLLAAVFRPIYLGAKMLNGLFCLFSWVFPFLPRLVGYSPNQSSIEMLSPKQRARRHGEWFCNAFAAHNLSFYEGGYLDALAKSKEELRYLLLIITSPDHVDMTAFANVITDPRVVDYISSKNILAWAGSVKDSEGYQLANGLDVVSFPFLGLVAPSPKTPQSNTIVMASLYKKNGYDGYSPEQIIRVFDGLMEEHGPKLLALDLDRRQRESARELREEQDAAYERSLQQDRDRAFEHERRSLLMEQESRQRNEAEQARLVYLNQLATWKSQKAQEFLEEPADNSTRVSIRLLSGERVIRRFRETDTVRTIYEYVLSYGADPATSDIGSFVPSYDFSLVSPMPRKVIPVSETELKSEPAIWPNGTLVVDEIDTE